MGGAAFRGGGTTTATVCEASGAGSNGLATGVRPGVATGVPVGIGDGVTDGCADVAIGLSPAGTVAPRPAGCEQPTVPSATAAISSPDTGPDARFPAIPAPKNDHVIRGVA